MIKSFENCVCRWAGGKSPFGAHVNGSVLNSADKISLFGNVEETIHSK